MAPKSLPERSWGASGAEKKVLELPNPPWENFPARFHRKCNLAIVEREARAKREPQARRAKQEREDRSEHCKRSRIRRTNNNKNHHERDSKSIETASPHTRP